MVVIEILERSDTEITIVLKGAPLEYVNAVRRATIEEVPTMAVDYVVFYDNTSALSDEMVSHRLAMIPLRSESALERYKPPEECKSDTQSDGCYVSLYLEAESGPQEELVVYSRDLRPQDDPEVVPVYGDIPILRLGPQQRVVLEAWARLGRGKEHIKWSPATVSILTYVPKVAILQDRCTACGLCAENCPTGAISSKDGRIVVDESKCTLCRQCVRVCEPEAIDLGWRSDEYRLRVESSGALRPERIVLEAMLQIKKKLIDFYDQLDRIFFARGVGS